jgi:biopolymer transport protein TolR
MNRLWNALAVICLASCGAAQSPVLVKGVSVQMATAAHAVPMPAADEPGATVVAITARGAVYLGITPVTPAALAEKLNGRGGTVYVKSDARTPYARVGEVLGALRTAGMNEPDLLVSQPEPPQPGKIVSPKGLEVRTAPPASGAIVVEVVASGLKVDGRQVSPAALEAALEKRLQTQSEKAVIVKAEGTAPFGEVVRVIDAARSAGASVFL